MENVAMDQLDLMLLRGEAPRYSNSGLPRVERWLYFCSAVVPFIGHGILPSRGNIAGLSRQRANVCGF